MRKLDKDHLLTMGLIALAILLIIYVPLWLSHWQISWIIFQDWTPQWIRGFAYLLIILASIVIALALFILGFHLFDWLFPRVTSDKNKEDGKE